MAQLSLFGPDGSDPEPKPASDQVERLRVLITVKAAPQPSDKYGETVCVAGVRADLNRPGWVRLYPINFRELGDDASFRKYDIMEVDCIPARNDPRSESWRPRMQTMKVLQHLETWKPRRPWLDSYIEVSMCRLLASVRQGNGAPSLALVAPLKVQDLIIKPHEGWTLVEQAKIRGYVNQLDLLDSSDRTPLDAPRFRGFYRYLCGEPTCRGHRQGLLDWEFVALQRRLKHLDDQAAIAELRRKFLDQMCDPKNDVAFYVGNQAKRAHVFSVLGVYYPKR